MSAVLVALLATTVVADENPDLMLGLDSTDPPTEVSRIDPAPNDVFMVYVVFKNFGPGGGMLGVAFMFDRTFSGFKLAQTNLLPGLAFGDVETEGWAITSGAECQYPDPSGYLVAASCQYMYTGTPGTITVVGHPVDGQSAADCGNELDFWTVYSNFGVNEDAPTSPVEASTWGAIKGLYR